MTPTNEQIIAEAKRRWAELIMTSRSSKSVDDFIIEVMREGWTPPEPEDLDLLAWRQWVKQKYPSCTHMFYCWELDGLAEHFIAGARMAREQERERAKALEARVAELEEVTHRIKYPRLRRRADNGGGQ